MEKQKKNDSGITLVALVVSIIVMLVLAGVSLNATIGENGIVTRAQEAVLQQRIAEQKEAIEHALTNINIDTLTEDVMPEIDQIARKLVADGVIDNYQKAKDADGNPTENVAVIIDSATRNRCFFGVKEDNKYKISRDSEGLVSAELVNEISGGDVEGLALVTKESFGEYDENGTDPNKGKFTITSNAEVMFLDSVTGNLSIYVPSGIHAKVSIYANMSLTNSGIKRSAIDIAEGGTLDLYIDDGVEVVVNSGLATAATAGNPGKGGYAGIHVPWTDTNGNGVLDEGDSYAVLNISGSTTESLSDSQYPKLYSQGGNASIGEAPTNSEYVSGGGGAGAGIGGNGGDGGLGQSGASQNGKKAGNAGYITINDKIKVYAYGGAGSSGTIGVGHNSGAGGGYPGAGIGGGGAGAGGSSCCAGSGGYSAGGADKDTQIYSGATIVNGGVATVTDRHTYNGTYKYWGTLAGGYYSGGLQEYNASVQGTETYRRCLPSGLDKYLVGIGGLGGCGENITHLAGNGGIGEMGGKVVVASNSKIYAFNGNRYTDGTSYSDGENEAPIYAQMGIIPKKYKWIEDNYVNVISDSELVTNFTKSGYINPLMIGKTVTINEHVSYLVNVDLSNQGIGSGAGYTEVYNGTYTIK